VQPQRLTILLIFVLSTSFIGLRVGAQTTDKALQKYSTAALQHDFSLLRKTLELKHPSLYRYKSKDIIDALLDSCFQSIRDSMTLVDFFRITCVAIGAIGDGHADCEPPQRALDDLEKSTKMFPLRVWIRGDKAYIFCEKDGLSSGTEIVSIDQHPVSEIASRMLDCFQGDGAIKTQRLHNLNDDPVNFSLLYYMIYGPKPLFDVEYRNSSGEKQKTALPADYVKNIRCDIQTEKLKGLALDFQSNGVAVLTVGTFDMKGNKFNQFLKNSFAEINRRQCRTVIIDLRNNGGGEDENGACQYSYLTNRPFSYYASVETVERKFRPEEHPQLRLQQPSSTPFLGDVYFLINGYTFSAAAEFCAVARSEKRGEFIGEETGGGYYGNTAGNDTVLVLPKTGIKVVIPLVKYTLAVHKAEYPDRGIIPEHVVIPSLADVIGHKDVQLQYALQLAGAN
jgi:C-terminal processing protease CtpA/Prc